MDVKLHPTKSFKIALGLKGAQSWPNPFCSRCKVHYGGIVIIGYTILCGLDNIALKGVLAHELAHIKKRHFAIIFLVFLPVFIPMFVYGFVSKSWLIIPILLIFIISFIIWIPVLSKISHRQEYEADAIAAEYAGGEKSMAYALEQAAKFIDRPGDTLSHPSFEKRIARLDTRRRLKEESQNNQQGK